MSGDGLEIYYGGLLYNACAPLEISMNWCSHNCACCFANLNNPNRTADVKQIWSSIANYRDRKTLVAHLMREKYPIVISNHIDPFAISNERITMPLLTMLCESEIPFTLQTRGGRKFYEALEIIDKPIVFYCSIGSLNDELTAKTEPGAPPPSERLKMFEAALAKGHKMNVGINPLVPEWLPEPEILIDELAKMGVWGAWVAPMHLSHKQIKNISPDGLEALGPEVIHQSLYHKKHPELQEHCDRTIAAAQNAGLQTYNNQQGGISYYFKPYAEIYEKTYPLMQGFVNLCHAQLKEGQPIYFSQFEHYFARKLPAGVWDIGHHIYAHVRASSGVFKNDPVSNRMTYSELLRRLWRDASISLCPVYTECFTFAADLNPNDTWTLWTDEEGLPILLFYPNGATDICTQWNQESARRMPAKMPASSHS